MEKRVWGQAKALETVHLSTLGRAYRKAEEETGDAYRPLLSLTLQNACELTGGTTNTQVTHQVRGWWAVLKCSGGAAICDSV